jgi:FkbM family methyltransferase
MNKELSILIFFTRKFPKIWGSGVVINRIVIPFFRRIKREKVISDLMGFKMFLDPHECIDSGLLFYPQLVDYKELSFIKTTVKENWVILDIGAHIGFYSLYLAQHAYFGSIYGIEADPGNYSILKQNISLNPDLKNIFVQNVGVSDKNEILSLGISTTGNTSGNSFFSDSKTRVDVNCKPLLEIVNELGLTRIDFIKIDIEGFEYRVFLHFFENANASLHPKFILLEDNPTIKQEGNTIELLLKNGYKLIKDFGLNKVMQKNN